VQNQNNTISHENETEKKILGIWNIDVSPLTIGGLIIFIEELQIQQIIHKIDSVEFCILGKGIRTARSYTVRNCGNIPSDLAGICDPHIIRQVSAIPIVRDFSNISRCYLVSSYTEFQRVFNKKHNSYILWPDIKAKKNDEYKYSNTRYTQQFFLDNGYIPRIKCKGDSLNWAKQFLNRNVHPAVMVVIHLKNNQNAKNCSNADFDAWYGFFKHYAKKTEIKFILIGNDPIDSRILTLLNVIVTKNHESNISRDLALISQAAIFMGMSSGPCNIAIFSDTPFIIYKNPDHDVEEMKLELGKNNRFVFSTASQKFLRIFETVENLIQEFEESYSGLIMEKSKPVTGE
jgi:hypothetical protein